MVEAYHVVPGSYTPVAEETLQGLEASLGHCLPDDYRGFMKRYGGCQIGPVRFAIPGGGSSIVDSLLGASPEGLGLQRAMESLRETYAEVPSGLVPIAEDPFGNYLLLSVRDRDFGAVYFLGTDLETQASRRGPAFLAASFELFMASVTPLAEKPPAAWALESGSVAVVRGLLDRGEIDVHALVWGERKPVAVAALADRADVVALLLEHGADMAEAWSVATQQGKGRVALLLIPRVPKEWLVGCLFSDGLLREPSVVTEAIRYGADCRYAIRRSAMSTPLHRAARVAGPEVVKLLIRAGSPVDACDGIGRTPLHWAYEAGNLASVAALLEAGADPLRRDRDGKAPEMLRPSGPDPGEGERPEKGSRIR